MLNTRLLWLLYAVALIGVCTATSIHPNQRTVLASIASEWPGLTSLEYGAWTSDNIYHACDGAGTAYGILECDEEGWVTSLQLSLDRPWGNIPHSIAEMTHLRVLSLLIPSMTGSLDSSWSQLSSLESLALESRFLTGSIPDAWKSMSSLKKIFLKTEKFTMVFPEWLSTNWTKLESFRCIQCGFQNSLPDSLAKLPHLQELEVLDDGMTAPFPSNLVKSTSLKSLKLATSELGSIPVDWSLATSLQTLHFDALVHPLPIYLPSTLQSLRFSFREEWGFRLTLPDVYFNHPTLKDLTIKGNVFAGYIPQLTARSVLEKIEISSNKIHGSLPNTLWIKTLQVLRITDTLIEGTIPVSAAAVEPGNYRLAFSNISHCLDLEEISLSRNLLDGDIPVEFSQLPKLVKLDLAANKIWGTLPDTWENSRALTHVNIQHNRIVGVLPKSIMNLPLKVFLFDYNSLRLCSTLLSEQAAFFKTVEYCRGGMQRSGECNCSDQWTKCVVPEVESVCNDIQLPVAFDEVPIADGFKIEPTELILAVIALLPLYLFL